MSDYETVSEALVQDLDEMAAVMKVLTPFVEPFAGPKWERFELSVWVRQPEPGILRFDGWDLRQSFSHTDTAEALA